LLSRAAEGPDLRLDVRLFDPTRTPGAGPNYDPALPEYLRMNFAAEQIDMWPTGAPRRESFQDWRDHDGDETGTDPYPPRAQVGRYLSDGLMGLLDDPGRRIEIGHARVDVGALTRDARGWHVNGERDLAFDEVLLATGHAQSSSRGLAAGGWPHTARLVEAVFPVDERLTVPTVQTGATVAIRGFALTMIDAALALTEGRGGLFAGSDPLRPRYESSGSEPAALLPYSRTGRPMLAKTDPQWARSRGLDAHGRPAREAIEGLRDPVSIEHGLLPALGAVAAKMLVQAGGASGESERIRDWLASMATGGTPSSASAAEELARSVAIAAGLEPPDHQWALGHAWRTSYSAIVSRFGGQRLAASQWPAFRRLAAEMERIAFGPPPRNAAKLLALVQAGFVDLGFLAGSLAEHSGGTCLSAGRRRIEVDVVVDAVLPGPGALGLDQEPVAQLVAEGLARVPSGRRGIELTPEAVCIGDTGEPTPGLAAVGRPTEDWVIGNDTLSRSLHDTPDRWARRVIGSAGSR
jgi:diaminopimelate decarboxylase